MNNFIFAPKAKSVHTTDINEALSVAEVLRVSPQNVAIGDIKVNENGTFQTNGEPHRITLYGFERFCKTLGIPFSFAQDIPDDLLLENIERLSKEFATTEVTLLKRDSGDIAGVCKAGRKNKKGEIKGGYKEPKYSEVLATFQEKASLKYINLSEELLTLCFWEEKGAVVKTEDDVLNVGTFVYSSILQDCKVHAYSGLYRSSCENSFVMPYFGRVRANYKHAELMLAKFSDLIQCFDSQIYNRLCKNFDAFNTRRLFDHEQAAIWRGIKRVANSSEADSLLHLDEENRKNLLMNVTVRTNENRRARLEGKPVSENVLTSVMAYDILNEVTSYSRKNLFGSSKRKMEKLAGDWIDKLILN